MANDRTRDPIHPLHGITLGTLPAFYLSALLADVAYMNTSEIQWSNFAQWLIAGGLLAGGIALIPAVFTLLRRLVGYRLRALLYLGLLAGLWIIAFINMLLHSRDAWFSVTGTGVLLSIVTALLAIAAAWIGFSGFDRKGEA